MRGALGKAVRKRFDEQMRRRLPQFKRDTGYFHKIEQQ
jgi:hypothetical protein